ncbi:hypothetical protein [uncultured Bartonella sp.]|uniref:hypothetical protein n=1 Tax=uncultured Bartonella sp. TaxID=104108 RepID=UPI0025D551B9|nr:hypothetical protein [uncultured Bartonella sp.]
MQMSNFDKTLTADEMLFLKEFDSSLVFAICLAVPVDVKTKKGFSGEQIIDEIVAATKIFLRFSEGV